MIKYEKTIWENDKTPVNAQHLGKVEDGLEYLFDVIKDVPAGEDNRIANEKQRQVNETTRQNNEIKRNDTLNAKVEEVDNAIDASNNNIKEVNNKFETIVASKQQDAEVILARGKYPSLPTRLDNLDKDLLNIKDTAIIPITTESDFETVKETTNGYLKNFKLEGKTLIVNSENKEIEAGAEGATLKSVGDGVEEVVVLTRKENGNICNIKTDIVNAYSYGIYENDGSAKSVIVRCEPNTKYYLKVQGNADRSYISTFTNRPKSKDAANQSLEGEVITTGPNDHYLMYSVVSDINVHSVENVYIGKTPFKGDFKHKSDKKKVLYYDTETKSWKKPILREWDSIEEHSNGKYYYHKRTYLFDGKNENLANLTYDETQSTSEIKCYYIQRDEIKRVTNCEDVVICDKLNTLSNYSKESVGISTYTAYESANPGKNWIYFKLPIEYDTVEKAKNFIKTLTIITLLSEEKVYECTPIDLIAYEGSTNYMIECGAVTPKSSFKYEGCVGNVINTLKEKVSYLEDKLYKTNLANFTVALNALDTKLKLEQLTKTPK